MKYGRTFSNLRGLIRHHPLYLTGLLSASALVLLTEALVLGFALPLLGLSVGHRSGQGLVSGLESWWTVARDIPLETRIRVAAAGIVVMMGVRGAAQYLQELCSIRLRVAVEARLQDQIFRQWLQVRVSYLQQLRAADLLSIQGQFVFQTGTMVQTLGSAAGGLIVMAGYLLVAFWISWPLALLGGVLSILMGAGMAPFLASQIRAETKRVQEHLRAMRATAHDNLMGMKQIHLFNREDWSLARFHGAVRAYLDALHRAGRLVARIRPLLWLGGAGTIALLVVGNELLIPGDLKTRFTSMMLLILIAFRLTAPLVEVNRLHAQIIQDGAALNAIVEFLHREDKPYLSSGVQVLAGIRNEVTLDRVSFRYGHDEPCVLKNVSMVLRRGCVTAVVGKSGSGKSTLVNLLTRLYDPQEGAVLVDGADVRLFKPESWRKCLAVVSQDVFLFHDTVAENLLFARPDATPEDLERAAETAQAAEFIHGMPSGYATNIYDRGIRLSGGQRQRLAIARALLVPADLLILDEATSELDAKTEQSLQCALAKWITNRAVLIIAHRLSTVSEADVIYVLQDGEVAEQGTHAELIARRGAYYRLAEAQGFNTPPLPADA